MLRTEDKGSALFNRLRAISRLELPQSVHDLADAYGAEFTNECLQPHELVNTATLLELPPHRQDHVQTCELCALMVQPPPNGIELPGAAAAAAVAATVNVAPAASRAPRRWKTAAITTGVVGIAVAIWKFGDRMRAALERAWRPTT